MTESYRAQIVPVLRRFPQVERAILFGSRAKGTERSGSDIDLALTGNQLDDAHLPRLYEAIDNLLLPVKVDLVILSETTKPELKDHIERVGVEWYRRGV